MEKKNFFGWIIRDMEVDHTKMHNHLTLYWQHEVGPAGLLEE